MIERIEHDDKLFAIILRGNRAPDRTEFFTPGEYPLQLGYLKYEKGEFVKPHVHKPFDSPVTKRQEVLFIRRGKVEATFYTGDGGKVGETILGEGDVILLADGGHSFRMMEESEIIEVKQGPYKGRDSDKDNLQVD